MKKPWMLLSLLVILGAFGCASKPSAEELLVGKWTGEIEMPEADENDLGAQLAKGFASAFKMDLEMKEDKTFNMTMLMFPIEGNWTVSGNQVTLTPTKVMGMDATELNEAKEEKEKAEEKEESDSPMAVTSEGEDKAEGEAGDMMAETPSMEMDAGSDPNEPLVLQANEDWTVLTMVNDDDGSKLVFKRADKAKSE